MLVHEVESEPGGCPFDRLFDNTPADLVAVGLYRPIALQWLSRAGFNETSVALVAQRLGARKTSKKDHVTPVTHGAQAESSRHGSSGSTASPTRNSLARLRTTLVRIRQSVGECSEGQSPRQEGSEEGAGTTNRPGMSYSLRRNLLPSRLSACSPPTDRSPGGPEVVTAQPDAGLVARL